MTGESMVIEVDQSNKIERTNKDTILAFSDGDCFCILIPANTKRLAIDFLRMQKSRKTAYLQIFAACLFILLRSVLVKGAEDIIIDTEYTGHEATIKSIILRHAYNEGVSIDKKKITFAQVGKGSRSHKIAWRVQRGQSAPDYVVTLEELTRLLK